MKEPIKFGLILLIFCAISAGLLSVVNGMTAPVIAEARLKATLESYEEIYGDKADSFEELDESKVTEIKGEYPEVDNIFVAKKGENIIGYGINIKATGFGGEMTNAIGFLLDGEKIAGFRNITNQETKGFGTQIEEEPYYSTYVDKSAKGPLNISKDPKAENEILWMTGATVSSKAVDASDNIAIEVFQNKLKSM